MTTSSDDLSVGIDTGTDTVEWHPVTLTYIEYPSGDFIGKMLALSSLLPLVIVTGFLTLVLFRRDLHTITFFLGILLNEAVNSMLKNLIKESRPVTSRSSSHLYNEYGMPSSHSQFMWFFAAYVALFVCIRLHHMNHNALTQNIQKATLLVVSVWSAVVVSISRVYLLYHTWQQVICGCILGAILGVTWFALTQIVFMPYFSHIVSWRISEILLLRDTTLIPNVLWFEYTNARQESRARARKQLVSMKSQ